MTHAVKDFATIKERDAFIDKHFPKRECTDTPGVYEVPGGFIGVRLNTVTASGIQPANILREEAL